MFLYAFVFINFILMLKSNYNEKKWQIEAQTTFLHSIQKENKNIPEFVKGNIYKNIENQYIIKKSLLFSTFFIILVIIITLHITYIQSSKKSISNAKNQLNFFHSIAHEFKSPLTSLQLTLQTFSQNILQPNQIKQLATNAESDIDRLKSLIENILLSTKIENNLLPNSSDINLSIQVRRTIQEYLMNNRNAKARTIELKIDDDCIIKSNEFAIKTLVLNLLENAIKYSPEHTVIKINIIKKNEYILWETIDEGEGIPRHEKHKIFEKFYRIDNVSSNSKKGIGIGLFLVKKILDQHDANIAIFDNYPTGTNFTVRFPINS